MQGLGFNFIQKLIDNCTSSSASFLWIEISLPSVTDSDTNSLHNLKTRQKEFKILWWRLLFKVVGWNTVDVFVGMLNCKKCLFGNKWTWKQVMNFKNKQDLFLTYSKNNNLVVLCHISVVILLYKIILWEWFYCWLWIVKHNRFTTSFHYLGCVFIV